MGILLVDIGNTALKWKLYGDSSTTGKILLNSNWLEELDRIYKKFDIEKTYLSSVKPSATEKLLKEFSNIFPVKVEDLKNLIKVDYKTPNTLGVDRLLTALGGLNYGSTFVVISVGSAVVVDLVKNYTFKGGSIFLGPQKELVCLNKQTELLPKVDIMNKILPPGQTTEESLQSGVLYSLKFSIEGFIKFYFGKWKIEKFLITGGFGSILKELLEVDKPIEIKFFENLVLEGLERYVDFVVSRG